MIPHNDEITIVLTGRNYIYQLLKRIFGDEPDLKLLETITDEFTWEVLELLFEEDTIVSYKDFFEELKKEISSNSDDTLDKLKREYTTLLVGPDKLPAPPWESIYVNNPPLLFQEATLKVRRAYLEYQMLPAQYPAVADDHLAIELDFMLYLGTLALENLENENVEKLGQILADQQKFLTNHLLVWISTFAEQIQESETNLFYPRLAMLTKEILQADYNIIEELLSAIKN